MYPSPGFLEELGQSLLHPTNPDKGASGKTRDTLKVAALLGHNTGTMMVLTNSLPINIYISPSPWLTLK
jgi:hypothetical protein